MTLEDIITFLEDEATEGTLRRADIERCVGLIAELARPFRFAVHQGVCWHGTIPGTFRVAWRQWHEGQSGTWITYGLCRDDDPMVWTAYEPDLAAIEEGTP